MKRKWFYILAIIMITTLACSGGVFTSTPTPRPTNEDFTIVPFMGDTSQITPQYGLGATPTPFPPCQPGWYPTADGCNKESYEYFAFTADTCVGMDDNEELFLIVRTSIGAGIDLPNGIKHLSCWMDHPSDFDGYQWYTSPELPTGIKEVLLYEGDGIASINYCIGNCSISEEPIWQGWVESSLSNESVWDLDQKITDHIAFYPDGFNGEIAYDFYTR